MLNNKKTLTPGQAAERLGVPVKTVRGWLRDGTLRGVKENNRWQIEESEADRLARTNERRARVDKSEEQGPEGEVAGMLFRVLGGERPTE